VLFEFFIVMLPCAQDLFRSFANRSPAPAKEKSKPQESLLLCLTLQCCSLDAVTARDLLLVIYSWTTWKLAPSDDSVDAKRDSGVIAKD
jgi:hypothetical protein